MDTHPTRGSGDPEGAPLEAAVLELLLARHPAQLTLEELVREIGETPGEPGGHDGVEQAVRGLVDSNLLQRWGAFVLPTRAALHFDRLLGG